MKPLMKLAEKEISIKAPWGKIAALTWGSPSNPPVLLCHGKMDVCSGFRPLVYLLPTTFYYVSVELPGNGSSDPFPIGGRYTVPDFVPAIVAVQTHFGWDHFIYIGHSLGVVIGKYFNLAYPGTITRMVELDPVPAYETWTPDTFNNCTMKPLLKLAEKEISIKAPWGKIAALTWGSPSNPPVLLCHGKMDVCSGFRPLVSLLPTTFYYVSVELPGNGSSDPFPIGGRYTVPDFVPSIVAVQTHFGWDHFIYIGHSLGVVIGKYFNLAYPGKITRMVELDPIPAYETWTPDTFNNWYHLFYGDFYLEEKYRKSNASADTAPKYTYEKTLHLMTNSRLLTKEAAEHVLERSLTPAGDGLYRFNYDQRQKEIPRMPLTPEFLKQLYTSVQTPTFTILAKHMIKLGFYYSTPFVKDESQWPNRNYKVKIVDGGHDLHINTPELIAEDLSKFLLNEKAKL